MLYRDQGRYADAEPLYKRSLAIYEKALGPDHPHVATALNNLAQLYQAQGRYADAEPLYKRSLAIYEKALGPDHPDVATSLNNLAELYQAQGRYADAEPLLQARTRHPGEGAGPRPPRCRHVAQQPGRAVLRAKRLGGSHRPLAAQHRASSMRRARRGLTTTASLDRKRK